MYDWWNDVDPRVIEEGSSYDGFILGFALGAVVILLLTKYIYKENEKSNNTIWFTDGSVM